MKCDERKPTCSRCIDRRLKCPGYPANVLKWSAKHEIHKTCTSIRTPAPSESTTTGEAYTQELTRRNKTIDGYDNRLDPIIQQGHHYAEPADLYGLLSPMFDANGSSYTDSRRTTFADVHPMLNSSEPTPDFPMTDSPFSAFETSFEHEGCSSDAATIHGVSNEHYAADHLAEAANFPRHDNAFVDGGAPPTYRRDSSTVGFLSDQNSATSPVLWNGTPRSDSFNTSLSPTILHIPTVLVEYYFQKVCRDCSTFDSPYNPFRSTVAEMQSNSAPINYVIQSLAASKLADDMPRMRLTGMEAQGKALEHLRRESMTANGLHNVSEEVLCSILLLGMTTSWHVREDLGVEYLILARRIIMAKSQAYEPTAKSNLEFYQNALKYWTMIVSIVSDRTTDFDESDDNVHGAAGPLPSPSRQLKKIMPHPWTGISPTPQQLFGQVLQLIRKTRGDPGRKQGSGYSRAGIASIFNAITAAERLEAKCWSLPIPSVEDIKDTEDTNTPPVHHVLTAKAYLLAALLHIYMVFPDVLDSRIQARSSSGHATSILEIDSQDTNMAHIVSAAAVWPQRSSDDPHGFWLRDLGLRVVECLEDIDVKSSTRVVHPPLLLSVASALIFVGRERRMPIGNTERMDTAQTFEQSDTTNLGQCQSIGDLNVRIRQCRAFITTRLETMHALMRFHAIDNILRVVKEVWRRADTGSQDIFWMDIMHELRCESIFG